MIANNIKIQYPEDTATMEIVITTQRSQQVTQEVLKLKEVVGKGKELNVEIKQHRKKRSLDANSYLWVILNEMAIALKANKDDVYLEMLSRYGVFTHIVVKADVVERVKNEWKLTKEIGEVVINDKTGIQLQCYFGSSTYNSKEFSTLLEGVIYEAKELNIETITPREKEELLRKWESKN